MKKTMLVEIIYDEKYLEENGTNIQAELDGLHGVDSVKEVSNDTVWRLSEGDIRGVIEDHFPQVTDENVIAEIIDMVRRNFTIEDWTDYVQGFISIWCDHLLEEAKRV